MRSMLFPALLALAVLLAGCSDDNGNARPNDRGGNDDEFGGNLTVNGTGNGTSGSDIEEEVCDTDPAGQEVGDYYVKNNGPGNQDIYEESNGMPDLQTPDTCPSNPDDQVAFAPGRT